MRCARCGTHTNTDDNFCRRCGTPLNRRGLPTIISQTLLPVPWSVARGPVIGSLAAMAAGTVVGLVRREMVRRAAASIQDGSLALLAPETLPAPRKGRFPWSRPKQDDYEVTVTVVQRRVRLFHR